MFSVLFFNHRFINCFLLEFYKSTRRIFFPVNMLNQNSYKTKLNWQNEFPGFSLLLIGLSLYSILFFNIVRPHHMGHYIISFKYMYIHM